jgi:hypothetical protein
MSTFLNFQCEEYIFILFSTQEDRVQNLIYISIDFENEWRGKKQASTHSGCGEMLVEIFRVRRENICEKRKQNL